MLAFLSGRGNEDELDQLWVMNRQGGEAERVTEFKGSVIDFSWAPDGKRLALIVEDAEPKVEKDKTKPPIVINRLQFKKDKEGYLTTKRQHLYLFDLRDEEERDPHARHVQRRAAGVLARRLADRVRQQAPATTSTARTTGTSSSSSRRQAPRRGG